ncbi:unnamed protein product [Dovyalis caffra]|uniref:Pentatricopeptide repeat-containing protein-mitochondrial domain-containing protein n=1 Tax=Dovyalis caffra TaxID=77055 RepID=A0AAV1R1K3_9ROSI|nr:unnamed protein product [Dovyalis caffra]
MSLSFLRKLAPKPLIPRSLVSLTSTASFSTFPEVPTSAYYDDLVNAAGHNRDLDTLHYLLNKRIRDHCFNTTSTFKFITNTETSLSILTDLIKTLARLDNGFPRKSAFEALIARLCKLDRVDESLNVVDFMARGKFGLNAGTFHPIICCLTRKKNMERSWRLIEIMRELGVLPDITSLNYLLTAYCFKGDLTAASGVMKRIEEEGLCVDSRTHDALVLGACKTGKVEGALVVLRRMEDDGVPVLYSTHAHVINALLKQGYYDQAVKFVLICGGKEKGLDTENFGILGSKLIKLERLKEAKFVLEEMEKRGLFMGDKLSEYYNLNLKNLQ